MRITIHIFIPLVLIMFGCSNVKMLQNTRESFLFVVHKRQFQVCKDNLCSVQTAYSTGSGFIIGNIGENTIGLTAGHVCAAPSSMAIGSSQIEAISLNGITIQVAEVLVYPKVDLCVLKLPKLPLPKLPISPTPPVIGEVYFNLAAPAGIFDPGMVPMLEGRYVGKSTASIGVQLDAYTIPAVGGSSGSMVVDNKGRVVGMIIMARVGFENFALSIPYELLREIISNMP